MAWEVAKGITVKIKDENNITTNLGVSSNKRFNPNSQSKSNFNDNINGDED
jgi:hypothetical protein